MTSLAVTGEVNAAPTLLAGYLPSVKGGASEGLVDDAIKLNWAGAGAWLTVDSWQFGDLEFVLFEGGQPVDVEPVRARSQWPGLIVGLCLDGVMTVSQGRGSVRLEPGRFTFYRGGQPHRVSADGPHRWLVCRLRFLRMAAVSGNLDELLAVDIPTEGTAAGLLVELLQQATTSRGTLTPRARQHCADALHSLVRAVIDDTTSASASRLSTNPFHRYMQWLEERIASPRIGAELVAAEHHVSVRHVRAVFADNGMTVSGFIRQRRLEHLRQDLLDPACTTLTVAALARRWGLVNTAAANRHFRAQYGQPPAAYRREHLRASHV